MQELINIVKNFKNKKILVVGDLMLDEYILGSVERISPEAPIPILDVKEIKYIPGGAANNANNIKSLGGEVILTGIIGAEDKGKLLKEILEKRGINTQGVFVDQTRKTTVKTRIVARDQQMVRVDSEDRNPIAPETENKILEFINGQIKGVNAVIISDYAKGVITPSLSRNIIELAKASNVLSLVDPKGKDYLKYKNCDIITPNQKELGEALNLEINNESQFSQAGRMLLSHVFCDNVIVKRGGKGIFLFGKEGNSFSFPAVNKLPKDVSGAGDTAVAAFALALASGADFKQTIIIASYACGVAVGKVGTDVVLPEELVESLKNNFTDES
ncbi:MAG: hypothetical protein A3A08_02550 [Candidatus Nealsonbacteria bacterium RIFCSPLOWO2_01_FULL_41_9]|uniref:Carbohydrate kinase PfkB domain-containing protein n=1 Tax=Candidatus Nealsonbacteria bacterium RIFCSPLOWO2_01_FULL_41_9 TaxID=1801671 RepID=A0A1G2ED36_9BACT|nr:MAG: hypothetical protein A3A08_02550 [Candidatus Nealsonbacteria bacterium RIFCSPLOWO2_01_FULL_41_9]